MPSTVSAPGLLEELRTSAPDLVSRRGSVFACRLDELQTSLHRSMLDAIEQVHHDMRTQKSPDALDEAVRGWLRDRLMDAAASGGVDA